METLRIVNASNKNLGFRSLNEIERALDGIRSGLSGISNMLERVVANISIEVDGKRVGTRRGSKVSRRVELMDAPSARVIERNFPLMDSLNENLRALDSMMAQLAYQFRDQRDHNRVVKEVKALRTEVERKIKEAYTAINKVARGKVSKTFTDFAKTVCESVIRQLDGSFDSSNQRLMVDMLNGELRFTHYLRFVNLEDSNKHVYREYNICITNVVAPRGNVFYVNTIPLFQVPGRFNAGVMVRSESHALEVINNILRSESFRGILVGQDIPLAEEDVPLSKFSGLATKVVLNTDSVTFTLAKGVTQRQAEQDLFLVFKGLIAGRLENRAQIRYKLGRGTITFYLSTEEPIKLNRHQLKAMQDELGLSDSDVKRVMQAVL